MSAQSPMLSIPKKSTDEVDWTSPIRNLIAQSYGENPENYSNECAALQRCRQDAVRGAGSDNTARDLLYKYYGQIELLELRFSEIKVNFPWRDAFTSKLVSQSSIAYEKASILFLIASTHSSLASSAPRSDPSGLKRSFHYFRTCGGMLTYINENFLHAPSTDLSRDVVKFLTGVIMAQATEVFWEKCVEEKKGSAPGLVSKIASQTAGMYSGLCEEVKEFMGKGIFDRNWILLLTIKSKYFQSQTQYHRALADDLASKHGDALARFTLASSLAKETLKLAQSFSYSFTSTLSPTLPPDAGTALVTLSTTLSTITEEKRLEAQRTNDLIYNAIVPQPSALPQVEKLVVAKPIGIQEVYAAPEVQKTIGQDIFLRLVPLSVHESASVYSEEKAKLVRGEVERVESAEGEMRVRLESMGVRSGLARFRAIVDGSSSSSSGNSASDLPPEVARWKSDISLIESREPVPSLLSKLSSLKESVFGELKSVERDLEIESRDCERGRVEWEEKWTQEPSAGPSKGLRQDLKSNLTAWEAAQSSDGQIVALWDSVKGDIGVLLSDQIDAVFREGSEGGAGQGESLLDLDLGNDGDEEKEREKLGRLVKDIDEKLGKLNSLGKERGGVLRELKDKIQSDDVSHLLLLNRRNTGVEPTLFANELNKFQPYRDQLSTSISLQEKLLDELATQWKELREKGGRGKGAKRWEEREKRKRELEGRFERCRDGYMEVRDGIAKGLQFYTELTDLSSKLVSATKKFIMERKVEREGLLDKIRQSSSASSPPPPPIGAKPPMPPPRPPTGSSSGLGGLENSMGGMTLDQHQRNQWGSGLPTPPAGPPSTDWRQLQSQSQPQHGNQSHGYQQGYAPSPPPTQQPQQQPQGAGYQGWGSPPPPPQGQGQQQQQHYRQNSIPLGVGSPSTYPPPPPPPSQNSHSHSQMYGSPPPPPPQGSVGAQGSDPYASLGMFGSSTGNSGSGSGSGLGSGLNTVLGQYGQPSHQQQGIGQQPGSHYGYTPSPPPAQQQHPPHAPQGSSLGGYGHVSYHPQQQQQATSPGSRSGFPPPPPAVGYGQQQYGSGGGAGGGAGGGSGLGTILPSPAIQAQVLQRQQYLQQLQQQQPQGSFGNPQYGAGAGGRYGGSYGS